VKCRASRTRRPAFWLLLAAVFMLDYASGARLHAQRPAGGSVRVASDHWSNAYIGRLRERGFLPGLNPLVQPWRAVDVARELATLNADTLPESIRHWVRMLQEAYGTRTAPWGGDRVRGGGSVAGGVRASTSRRLDPARPLGDEGAWPRGQAGGWLEAGPVAAELRLLGDRYFPDDPDGADPEQSRGLRSDFAYVAADFPVASLELGRFARNWSRFDVNGLMVSDVATPYPQLGLDIRAWRFVVRAFSGELEVLDGRKRYVAGHRIDYESPNLVVSFGEVNLYAPDAGGFSLRWLNPLESFFFEGDNQPLDATNNLMLDLQVWVRIGSFTLHGEGALDDFDLSPPAGVDRAPARYAFRVSSRWAPSRGRMSLLGSYEQVSSFAYRTVRGYDGYAFLGRGLGENYADFDRGSLSLEYAPPVRGLVVSGSGHLVRQGEGDFRRPFGDYDAFRGSPALFLGVREDTYRLGFAGRYQPTRFAWLTWDLGYNWIQNRGHVQDADDNLFSAAAELGIRIDFPFRTGS
jgi:hypothetical protein